MKIDLDCIDVASLFPIDVVVFVVVAKGTGETGDCYEIVWSRISSLDFRIQTVQSLAIDNLRGKLIKFENKQAN